MAEEVGIYLIAFLAGALLSMLLVKESLRKEKPLVGIFISLLLFFGAVYGIIVEDFEMALISLYLAVLFIPEVRESLQTVKYLLVTLLGGLILLRLERVFIKVVVTIGIAGALLGIWKMYNTKETKS